MSDSIAFEAVGKKFATAKDAVWALRNLTFQVPPGERLAILGPSGAGKTTLLRLIAGFETVSSGRILKGGNDFAAVPPEGRNVAMIAQNPALYPHMTAGENIGFALKLKKVGPEQISRKVRETAEAFGLGGLLEKRPDQLSGGEQQRVALARAFVREPGLLLLDEPFNSLDPELRRNIREQFSKVQETFGITTFFVTHDIGEGLAFADRVLLLQGGMLREFGTPKKIYLEPSSLFAARFLSADGTNEIPVTLIVMDSTQRITSPILTQPITLPIQAVEKTHAIKEGILLLRPHELTPVGQNEGHLSGEIVKRSFLGPETELRVKCGEIDLLVRVPSFQAPALGDILHLRMDLSLPKIFPVIKDLQ
ncbi:MAG: ABC transporter ATP-binding protein [Verrucomicrobiota bacterium]|nr:ABC transporter ATP-binding protein [Verrucomicrobiota bacterium]